LSVSRVMAGVIMNILHQIKVRIRSLNIELLTIWFVFWDRRVRWHIRGFLLLPITYVMSPIDLISDMIPLWGQFDDVFILRISYLMIRKFVSADILDANRERATAFWNGGSMHKLVFWIVCAVVWGFAIFVLGRLIYRRVFRYM
jgi:uncharacterized membrane protein YkvA (DUF1232 family)